MIAADTGRVLGDGAAARQRHGPLCGCKERGASILDSYIPMCFLLPPTITPDNEAECPACCCSLEYPWVVAVTRLPLAAEKNVAAATGCLEFLLLYPRNPKS